MPRPGVMEENPTSRPESSGELAGHRMCSTRSTALEVLTSLQSYRVLDLFSDSHAGAGSVNARPQEGRRRESYRVRRTTVCVGAIFLGSQQQSPPDRKSTRLNSSHR